MERKIARRARVRMMYKKVDISRHCTEFSFTSNAEGQLDHISLQLQDRDGRVWQGEKWPLRGDILEPVIIVEDWKRNGDYHELICGQFELDQPTLTGPPDVIDLKGTTAKMKTSSQAEKKTTGWEKISLKQVAGDIVGRNGYGLVWKGKDKTYERLDQKFQADLAYLERLAREAGNVVKVVEGDVHIIDLQDMMHEPPSFIFSRLQSFEKGPAIETYSFTGQVNEKYKACQVIWQDTKKGERFSGVYNDPNVPRGETLVIIDKYAESNADAESIARQILTAKNRHNITGELTIIGDTFLKGGLTCLLKDFGGFSGKYLITQATHKPLGRYTVRLKIQGVA